MGEMGWGGWLYHRGRVDGVFRAEVVVHIFGCGAALVLSIPAHHVVANGLWYTRAAHGLIAAAPE